MPASVILEFGFTSGETPVCRVFEPGNIAGGVLGTSSGIAEVLDAGGRATGRYSPTFVDLPSRDYLMIAYVSNIGVYHGYYSVAASSGRYLPWHETNPQHVISHQTDAISALSLSDAAVTKIVQAVLTGMNSNPPLIDPESILGYQNVTRRATVIVYRQSSDALPVNFSWSYADSGWDGTEFTITRSIDGGTPAAVVGAVAAVGADSLGKYRFTLAYNAADYPEGAGVVDFSVTDESDVTVVFRVIVQDTASLILGQDPTSFGDNTVGGCVRDIIRKDRTHRYRQISRSADNKSSDTIITEVL